MKPRAPRNWTIYHPVYRPRPGQTGEGIRTRSRHGEIGDEWWSKRFVSVVESLTQSVSLNRGRRFARAGQVMDLVIEAGRVTSRVQSASEVFEVSIDFKTLGEALWTRVEKAMADRALFAARLLAGEMPHEIEEVFVACGVNLFPKDEADLVSDCTCLEYENPCAHVAATVYILAERFDEDPFLLLAWRGRTQDQLLQHLRVLRGGVASESAPDTVLRVEAPPREVVPLPSDPEAFWHVGTGFGSLGFQPLEASVPDMVLRLLGPCLQPESGVDLADRLRPLYPLVVQGCLRRAFGESHEDEPEPPRRR